MLHVYIRGQECLGDLSMPTPPLVRKRRMKPVNTVIVGAGVAGRIVLEEIAERPDLNYVVKGFVDDNPDLRGKRIGGAIVLGSSEDLPRLKRDLDLEEAIIAMPSVKGMSVRKIVELCRRAGLTSQIVPGAVDVLTGRATVSAARPVSVEDMLRREMAVLSEDVKSRFEGQSVLVTGAAGSIGSELCRSLCGLGIRRLIALDTDENGVFELELDLRSLPNFRSDIGFQAVVGSIANETKVEWVLRTFRPQIVFHAAARKHVPLMEDHPEEAVETNLHGTRILAEACAASGVDTFINISTDKAVEPSSVMGATKRLAELVVRDLARAHPGTKFVTVRFGNVIGSRGSVLQVFGKQLASGKPLTITNPEMTRYFMTANEAAVLLLQSVVIGRSGDILVLDMGDPIRLLDLAKDLIALSGYGSDKDLEYEVVGPRPGEKMHEKLHGDDEVLAPTNHDRILRVVGTGPEVRQDLLQSLVERARTMNREAIIDTLKELLPGYGRAGGSR